jgi:5-methylcytosine-specific restriction endonuclease McrA
MRAQILARDGWTCRYCGAPAHQVDHVRALADGGAAWNPANLCACCQRCNHARGQEVRRRRERERERLGITPMTAPIPRRRGRVRFGAITEAELRG